MKREDIEQSTKGNLLDFQGNKNLLVSFGGIQQGLGIPVFEFFNSMSDIPCDKIFLRDFNQAWYQKGVDSEIDHIDKIIDYLKDKISKNQYDKICFIGNSMGGYAAILFGSILNVDCVISFAPQTFIDKFNRFINIDRRWRSQLSKVHNFQDNNKEYFDLKEYLSQNQAYETELNIYYSAKHRLDKKHAERLKRIKNVRLHPIREGGHGVVKTVRDNGELKSLIQATFELTNTHDENL